MSDPIKALPTLAENANPGAVVVFLLALTDQQALTDAAGLDGTPDHLTLQFITDDASSMADDKLAILAALAEFAREQAPIVGRIGGVARFTTDEGDGRNAVVALFDSPDLPEFQSELTEDLCDCCEMDESEHGFTPHITLGTIAVDAPTPQIALPDLEIEFDTISLIWAGERIDLPLMGQGEHDAETLPAMPMPGYAPMPMLEQKALDALDDNALDDRLDALDDRAECLLDWLAVKANYSAGAGGVIVGNLGRGAGGQFQRAGAGGGDTGGSNLMAELTKKKEGEIRAKMGETGDKAGVSRGLLDGLAALGSGEQPGNAGDLTASGLAQTSVDGQVRLTSQGKAALRAAGKGDAATLKDAILIGKEKAATNQAKEARAKGKDAEKVKKAQAREAARKQREADREKKRQDREAKQKQREADRAKAKAEKDAERAARASTGTKTVTANDTLVFFGSEVKALGDGRVGGYLVRFSGPDDPDLSPMRDFFTPQTYFGPRDGDGVDTYFHHAIPVHPDLKALADRTFAPLHITKDALGLFAETVLNLADDYDRKVYEMAQAGRLGWSSGAPSHLVRRRPVKGANEVTRWPIAEGSLTPTPAEPRNRAYSLKALIAQEADSQDAAASADGDAPGDRPITTSDGELTMDGTELKTILDAALATALAPLTQRIEAIEQAPAVKTAGFLDGKAPAGIVRPDREGSLNDFLYCIKAQDKKRLNNVYHAGWSAYDDDGNLKTALAESSGVTGGYTVPATFENEISRLVGEAAIFTDARVYLKNMTSLTHYIPKLKQTAAPTQDGQSAYYGGLYFTWTPEAGTITEAEPSYDLLELRARKAAVLAISSNELVEDSPGAQSDLVASFAEALAHALDWFYLNGNGVGKPLGIFNSSALITVTRSTTVAGANVEAVDLANIMGRFLRFGGGAPVWIANNNVIGELIQMTLGYQPVFLQNANVTGPYSGTLFGLPLALTEKVPAIGTAGDIGLYDLKAYAVGRRRGMLISTSEHYRFGNDQLTWRVTYRGDGQPRIDGAVPQAAGTSLSPFVRLATNA